MSTSGCTTPMVCAKYATDCTACNEPDVTAHARQQAVSFEPAAAPAGNRNERRKSKAEQRKKQGGRGK